MEIFQHIQNERVTESLLILDNVSLQNRPCPCPPGSLPRQKLPEGSQQAEGSSLTSENTTQEDLPFLGLPLVEG